MNGYPVGRVGIFGVPEIALQSLIDSHDTGDVVFDDLLDKHTGNAIFVSQSVMSPKACLEFTILGAPSHCRRQLDVPVVDHNLDSWNVVKVLTRIQVWLLGFWKALMLNDSLLERLKAIGGWHELCNQPAFQGCIPSRRSNLNLHPRIGWHVSAENSASNLVDGNVDLVYGSALLE